jgi:hypothetical protein
MHQPLAASTYRRRHFSDGRYFDLKTALAAGHNTGPVRDWPQNVRHHLLKIVASTKGDI